MTVLRPLEEEGLCGKKEAGPGRQNHDVERRAWFGRARYLLELGGRG
ncbi:MAG: hypothetical protein N3B14_06060 [Thermoleophilia bacterium]|nr:hypothetical protein [Thermoleophilia bacterium]